MPASWERVRHTAHFLTTGFGVGNLYVICELSTKSSGLIIMKPLDPSQGYIDIS
jgi:hypothetical protein